MTNATGVIGAADVTDVTVTCTTDTFTVGGTVTGLVGSGLVLQNSGGDDLQIQANGTFAFATEVASNASYAVVVAAQPTSPWQTCTVTAGTGTVTSAAITSVAITCATNHYAVGGTVTGLAGDGLVLRNSGGDDLAIGADGTFTFPTRVASGAAFAVTVHAQPSNPTQTCTVSGGSGTVAGGDVTTITVNCATNTYAIGGTISGLASTVELTNNLGESILVSANGDFAFADPIASGETYDVTVAAQPTSPWQTCTVTAGSGTVTNAPVTSVEIACTTNRYPVGGTVSGLPADGTVVLRNNGANDLAVSANGAFAFAVTVPSGEPYAVTVLTHPADTICTVSQGTGTIAGSAITDVVVSCAPSGFTTSGTVTLLEGGQVELQDASGATLIATASGPFAFPTRTPTGAPYAVTVKTPPTGQNCVVERGAGTMGTANVTDIAVTCMTACFQLTNDGAENLTGNTWLDACAAMPGNTVRVMLRDAAGTVVYNATGPKVGTWTFDQLTSTVEAWSQYDVDLHDRLISLDNGDRLMITGRNSDNAGCWGSFGSGYGIALFGPTPSNGIAKMLVMPYLGAGSSSSEPRWFSGWTQAHEISWAGGATWDTCGTPATAFQGTFSIAVLP